MYWQTKMQGALYTKLRGMNVFINQVLYAALVWQGPGHHSSCFKQLHYSVPASCTPSWL